MSDFADIKLIECSRMASVQARTGNDTQKGVFTVKLGNSIDLEPGDTINIQNAFVSEDGAGVENGIEFKGEPVMDEMGTKGVEIELEETEITTTYSHAFDNLNHFDEIGERASMLINEYDGKRQNTKVRKQLYDNGLFLETSFWKSNNGENCFFMPRRWMFTAKATAVQTFDEDDTEATGQCYFLPEEEYFCCSADYFKKTDNQYSVGGHTRTYFKPKTNNNRFTMFMKTINYRDYQQVPLPKQDYFDAVGNDIMLNDYVEYKAIKEIIIKKGFNSPNSIAEQVTEQLQKSVQQDVEMAIDYPQPDVLFMNDNLHRPAAEQMPTRMFSTWHSNCNKPVYSHCYDTMTETAYNDFHGLVDSEHTCDHIAAYQYIYVKRPDLFVEGRKITDKNGNVTTNEHGGVVPNYIQNSPALAGLDPIVTSWEYTTTNLTLLSNLFKVQYNYPDLWAENAKLSIGRFAINNKNRQHTRFLHINRWQSNVIPEYTTQLGSDNYTDWSATAQNGNHQSVPIFFKFDSRYIDRDTGGKDLSRLSYGFATKTLLGGIYYITIHPELIGPTGWKDLYFDNFGGGAGPIPINSVQIGWDWHANSYGNVVMGGHNGFWDKQYDDDYAFGVLNKKPNSTSAADKILDLSNYLNVFYLGANQPALTYDAVGNSFGFQYLHTVENVGQPQDAGATSQKMDATENTSPLIADAGNECYKINKRLQYWNFSPDMRPYKAKGVNLFLNVGGTHNDYTTNIKPLNENIEAWSIFDSHGGVFLNCGKTAPKGVWHKSILGILGFSYEQFNPTIIDNFNNENARINFNNINNLNQKITTNSEVLSTDTSNFSMNIWGGINYGPQISPPLTIQSWTAKAAGTRTVYNAYYPAITEQTTSIIIKATGLPVQIRKPYYTVRSDILDTSKYTGGVDGTAKLDVLGVINKTNPSADYYQLEDGPLEFTVTTPQTITEITTSIHDPDQTLARCDDTSSVIYKITRLENTSKFNILQQILEEEMQKKKSNRTKL